MTYTLGAQTFQWAGTYTSQFTILAGDVTATINGPSFAVHTNAPTVSLKSVSSGNANNSISGNTATVYFAHSEGSTSGCSPQPTYTYDSASVTIQLSGMGVGVTSATLTFTESNKGTVHLYSTANNTSTRRDYYTWTGNGDCTMFVGVGISNSTDSTARPTYANKLTATELVIEYSGVVFNVDVPDITINNPS